MKSKERTYKVGDRVKLTSTRPMLWNPEGAMDCFLGSTQKIKAFEFCRPVFEDPGTLRWSFQMSDIESLVTQYPKVMLVSDNETSWLKRVVFEEKCGKFVAWSHAESLYAATTELEVTVWNYAKDVPATVELTIEEIAEKFGILPSQVRIKE